jgi:hypothetical protein
MEDLAIIGFMGMGRKEMFGEGSYWIDLAQDRDQTNTWVA